MALGWLVLTILFDPDPRGYRKINKGQRASGFTKTTTGSKKLITAQVDRLSLLYVAGGNRFGYSVVKIQMDLFLPSPETLSEMEAKSDD